MVNLETSIFKHEIVYLEVRLHGLPTFYLYIPLEMQLLGLTFPYMSIYIP